MKNILMNVNFNYDCKIVDSELLAYSDYNTHFTTESGINLNGFSKMISSHFDPRSFPETGCNCFYSNSYYW
jgi:hypothetical protein